MRYAQFLGNFADFRLAPAPGHLPGAVAPARADGVDQQYEGVYRGVELAVGGSEAEVHLGAPTRGADFGERVGCSGENPPGHLEDVAAGDAETPSDRSVTAIGEAKVGERLSLRHLLRLEEAREALGQVADSAKLLLFGQHFETSVLRAAEERDDLEIIDLARLYEGD